MSCIWVNVLFAFESQCFTCARRVVLLGPEVGTRLEHFHSMLVSVVDAFVSQCFTVKTSADLIGTEMSLFMLNRPFHTGYKIC